MRLIFYVYLFKIYVDLGSEFILTATTILDQINTSEITNANSYTIKFVDKVVTL